MSELPLAIQAALPAGIAQVGRQPILDCDRRTYGYELLYRADNVGPGAGMDGDQATARTVLNTFMEFGLRRLAGSHRVFINLTRAFITDTTILPLDKERLVLEVLEDIHIDGPIVAGVARLHQAGYQLALDDYRFEARWNPLLSYASMVKVDIHGLDLEPHRANIQALKQRGLILLAEKVETQEEFELTRELGFDLFQGYFFAKPQVISGERLNCNPQLLLKLLSRINDPACDIRELAKLVSLDPKLSFKILRFINSSAVGLARHVASIQEAVVYIGLNKLRGWTSLFVMAGIEDTPPEVITTSLVRAELCAQLCRIRREGDPDSAYTVGLLSILDALLNRPMAALIRDLGLPADMIDAMVSHAGPYGKPLSCALALERGQWLIPTAKLLPLEQLSNLYVDALTRAEESRAALS